MNPKIAALINDINKNGFYSWLINDQSYKDQNGEDYCGSCPCFFWLIKDLNIELDCSCWRTGDFKYSGLSVTDKNVKQEFPAEDLEILAKEILKDISERWFNTDWEYRINDGEEKEYK